MRISGIAATALLSAAFCLVGCGPSASSDGDDEHGGQVDDDGDGFTTGTGDCNDHDDTVYPGAPELDDDLDNDCDTAIDDDLPFEDDDGDGYNNVEGDCDDSEPLVNPGSVEVNIRLDDAGNVVPEGVDNDCDGLIDEGTDPCDLALAGSSAMDYAKAMELCAWIETATFSAGVVDRQRGIRPRFGNVYVPHAGNAMAVLSTGAAVDRTGPLWVNPGPGTTSGGATGPHPSPQGDPADDCGQADPPTVNDYVSLSFTIKVPSNANSLAYDFNFMSAEFPIYVCSQWDDTFLAILDSQEFDGNISFDDAGRPVTINVGFFDVCAPGMGPNCSGAGELGGTGFESYGGTGWLHSIAPVTPGETLTLTFHLFDEGDTIWDSLVLLDNFQWLGVPVDGPITVDREVADDVHTALIGGATIAELRDRY